MYPGRDPANRDWQAESDANVLADAEKIKDDPERFSKAQQAAARIVVEKERHYKMMEKVAKYGMNSLVHNKVTAKPVSGKKIGVGAIEREEL